MYSYFNLFSLLVGAGTTQTLICLSFRPSNTVYNNLQSQLSHKRDGPSLLLVDISLYLFNAALKFRFVGYSLFIISITCSYVVSDKTAADP